MKSPVVTQVLYTVDTELSIGSHVRGVDPETNLAQSIFGRCSSGSFGIGHQMSQLNAYGLKGVFFVDSLPGAVFGVDMIKRIVDPILESGHEVQLHLHPAWTQYMPFSPVDGRDDDNIGNFDEAEQRKLIELGMELLVAAGAPTPVAFRAGNFGADDRTLAILASLGLRYDSSFDPVYLGAQCRISLPPSQIEPVEHMGVTELPVSCIFDRPNRLRHVQLCALSSWEMRAALDQAIAAKQGVFTIVSHSFELLSRDRKRANRTSVARFEALCAALAERPAMTTVGYETLSLRRTSQPERLQPSLIRTALRLGEQIFSSVRDERAVGKLVLGKNASAVIGAPGRTRTDTSEETRF